MYVYKCIYIHPTHTHTHKQARSTRSQDAVETDVKSVVRGLTTLSVKVKNEHARWSVKVSVYMCVCVCVCERERGVFIGARYVGYRGVTR
jgi:hypothetical protein